MATISDLKWDEERTLHKIKLQPEQIWISPLGNDAIITVKVGEQVFDAMVPTASLGPERRFVPAEQVGRIKDKLLIVLPTGNDGTTTWQIRKDALKQILFE